ncbi:MAG: AAA family ATPase [Pseudomonadales bacterium]|nr:AAA family ATPase [Pseudomonadales bacterium]
MVLIFGENGTGKSTIVDAIECVGSGSTAFLDDWKLGKGKRKESFIPTLGKSLADVKIELEFGDQTYNATLDAKGIKLCNTSDRPNTKVLRRKSLQAFIDADPAQRYKEVASFLDIPQIETSETTLRQAYKEAKDKFEFATKANTQALETLQGLWEAEGGPGLSENQSAEAWARNQANTPLDALETDLAKLKLGVKRVEELVFSIHGYEQANAQVIQAQENLQQAENEIAALESDEAQSNAQLVTLLQDAKSYLSKTPDTICPVCEQTEIEPVNLVQRLDRRIAGMDELKQANDKKVLAQKHQQNKSTLLQPAVENLLKQAVAAQEHFTQDFPKLESIQNIKEDKSEQALQVALTLHSNLASRQAELQTQLNSTQKQCHTLTSIKQLV